MLPAPMNIGETVSGGKPTNTSHAETVSSGYRVQYLSENYFTDSYSALMLNFRIQPRQGCKSMSDTAIILFDPVGVKQEYK